MKILFVATRKNSDPTERELYEMDLMCEILGFRRSLLDLGVHTIAACTPAGHEVIIRDEYLAPINYDEECDLVALSAKTSCVSHAYDVASKFRRRGRTVVLGGIHATLRPDEALEHVDHIVTGEAEEIWLEFLDDFVQGKAARRYDARGFPDMAAIPVPEFGGLDAGDFLFHQLQTTRGCPFNCRFCSVPDISGQGFRFKPVERIVREIGRRPLAGRIAESMKAIYIVDDNFISRPQYTKELLRSLISLRERGDMPDWSAETTLNVAQNSELLDLLRDAGCTTLIIGFESISEATLKEMRKGVNFCLSYPEAIERIHQRGMSIVGNFIVGFDTDDLSVFNQIRDFVFDNNILYPFFSILTPMPGTELHEEFKRDGRLDTYDWTYYDTRHVVYPPKNMTRDQLMDGYAWLYEQCYTSDDALANLVRYWERPERRGSRLAERLFIRWRVFRSRLISKRNREFFRRGLRAMTGPGKKGDVGQLLYYMDSGSFAEALERDKSTDYEHHAKQFERTVSANGVDPKQWNASRFEKSAASTH